jgi:hypothetical protein
MACKKRTAGTETSGGTILPVPETKTPDGWPLYEVKREGFAIALPPEWRQFDMNPATFEKSFQEGAKNNPELMAMFPGLMQQVRAGMKFFGIDEQSAKTGFATNVNILRMPLPPGGNLDLIASDSVRLMEQMPNVVKPIARERLKTGAGDCERLRYQMRMQSPKGKADVVAISQFLFATSTDGFVVTLTTTADREAHYRDTFDKIGHSFRFVK